MTNSIRDLRTLLQMQDNTGRVPEMIFWVKGFWSDALDELLWGDMKAATITQTPMIVFSLERIWRASGEISVLKEFVPKVVALLDWWVTTRDPAGSGLVAIIHGWESGLDASPAYDEAYGVSNPKPKFLELYPKFYEFCFRYRDRYHWNETEIVRAKDAFFVQDLLVNSVVGRGWKILGSLAGVLNNSALQLKCAQRYKTLRDAVVRQWNPALNRFPAAIYRNSHGDMVAARAESVQSMMPLLFDDLPSSMVDAIIETQLTNTSRFWSTFPIPSTSLSDPAFEARMGGAGEGDLMWRGPTWPILTFLCVEGLLTHGRADLALKLVEQWVLLYSLSGVYEQYNPLTGAPYGPQGLGMSTLIVDAMYTVGILKNKSFT